MNDLPIERFWRDARVERIWDGTSETEDLIKNETKATIRCMPLDFEPEEGVCIRSGKPSNRRVLFALAY